MRARKCESGHTIETGQRYACALVAGHVEQHSNGRDITWGPKPTCAECGDELRPAAVAEGICLDCRRLARDSEPAMDLEDRLDAALTQGATQPESEG